ncbi:succinyldiaminopimelate transaminase [Nitrosomonas supralitoralis]|uniref:Succinyldiaminopimelate transaminase n=1 Tax=Nitrosomonas supralitoralis TaxID=2116706 RepID=A0A2P7NY83_9PROT|nr:succinyldiaminopimelate transaminase [Nitrosomonas supralitoralis]PSJ18423.1 succinyldiaminopimelate transaminase [Nitrosomonas supralitoralis]
MNPNLSQLQPYPFQKLRQLFEGVTRNTALNPIDLQIGEPKHATPDFIRQAIIGNLAGLSTYPTTLGIPALRNSISAWIERRFNLPEINPDTEIIPVNGSREALFSFAQAVIDPSAGRPAVICPNPFYQIYEGAALLAGATPYFVNTLPENHFRLDFSQLSNDVWSRTQLIYVCSPNNPTGGVMTLEEWRELFALSDRYGFVVASDECYSEIHFDESNPPLCALDAANQLGRVGFPRLVVFNSLSKRSNVPGMRSGFVAGDAAIMKKFLLYRTYHGCAMNPAAQAASAAAWNDEEHVRENRRLYAQKFIDAMAILSDAMAVQMPDAGFYLWIKTPIDDTEFTRQLYQDYNVTVLPGSYLARDAQGSNPGKNYVRIALVTSAQECIEAMQRIKSLVTRLN